MIWRTCPQCGKTFRGHKTHCSVKCGNDSRKGSAPWNKETPCKIICIICGKEFEVPKVRKDSAKYCSDACKHEAKRRITGKEHPLFLERKIVKCQWCGKEFKVKPSKELETRYCSRFCVGSATTAAQGGRKSSLELIVKNELEMLNIDFIEQQRLGRYLVDFYLPESKIVIEADGDYWHNRPERKQKDIKKDQDLKSRGYKVLRFKEQDIKNNIKKCMNLLKQAM
jgi:very-short-patch-repair endonuclease